MRDHIDSPHNQNQPADCDHTLRIEWIEKYPDLMPGKLFFHCERLSAHLTHESCHQNWALAHGKITEETPMRLMKCRGCPVGRQLHSDTDSSGTWQDFRAKSECVRCGRRQLRIISGAACVSCWNREREGRIGKDARGKLPKTRMVLHPHRIGLVGVDGKLTWRRFDAWHEGEAISRAIRQIDGATFHDQQPGKTVWNKRVRRFQYRCNKHPGEFGTLRELVADDGAVTYRCPVCEPGRARGLPDATVTASTSIQTRDFAKDLMQTVVQDIGEHWIPTAHICDQCRHYALEVRARSRKLECRCPMCDR
jgi:hypothetical protein